MVLIIRLGFILDKVSVVEVILDILIWLLWCRICFCRLERDILLKFSSVR